MECERESSQDVAGVAVPSGRDGKVSSHLIEVYLQDMMDSNTAVQRHFSAR